MSPQNFRYIINGYCKGRIGANLIERGDFDLIRSYDNQDISPAQLIGAAKPGTLFEMSIILRRAEELKSAQRNCPRCHHTNSTNSINSDAWIEWQVVWSILSTPWLTP